jgi:ABC-type transport system substrate-binding protein
MKFRDAKVGTRVIVCQTAYDHEFGHNRYDGMSNIFKEIGTIEAVNGTEVRVKFPKAALKFYWSIGLLNVAPE